MPHIVIEYSSNVEQRLSIEQLVETIHETALANGPFARAAARTRAARRDVYRVADGNPDAAFIHVVMRIGHGRDLATKQTAGEAVFAALCTMVQDGLGDAPIGLTLEIHDIPPEAVWRKNNLHAIFGSTPPQ